MKKTTGQSILEYCFIAIIVILGIVIMGPYVLRSIDAHFKMWDEGARDSFSETIQQAPVSAVPDITTNCSCPASQGSCGSAQAGPNGCGPTEREWDYNCTPQGCNGAEGSFYCVNDPACCIDQPQGCGGVTCPAGGCNLGPSPPAQGNDCYYGYEKIANVCGSSVSNNLGTTESETTCTSNSSCLPICKGITSAQQDNISAGFAAPCPGSPGTPAGTTPLLQNEDITFVQTQNQQTGSTSWCSSGTACQYYCTNGAWDPANPGVCAKTPQCAGCTVNVFFPSGRNGLYCGGYLACPGMDLNALCKYFGFDHSTGLTQIGHGATNSGCIANPQPSTNMPNCNAYTCGGSTGISIRPNGGCSGYSPHSGDYIQGVQCSF